LTNDVSRAEAINGILVDAGNKPERYLEAFEIKGGGE
jgi:hypothetical protein